MKYALSITGAIVLSSGIAWGGLTMTKPITFTDSNYINVAVVPPPAGIAKIEPLPIVEPQETTLLFGGDVMLSRGINDVMRRRDDFVYPFRQLKDLTTEASITVVNLEGPISSHGKNIGSIYSFRADPKAIEGLTFAGIDLVTLANNHTGDYGPEALTETLGLLHDAGIMAVGAGANMTDAKLARFLNVNNLKFAFLGATPLSPSWLTHQDSMPAVAPFDEKAIIEGITEAKKKGADVITVLLHWGNEYETTQLHSQELVAHHLVDAGATLVIGHHPHVVQNVERYHGGVIAYSLGNFIFDQNTTEDTRHGLLLKVSFKGSSLSNVEEIPIKFSNSYQPYLETAVTAQ